MGSYQSSGTRDARERRRQLQRERQRVYQSKPEVRARIAERCKQRRASLRETVEATDYDGA
jgi:hypothetical protein